jgi:dTDP-4-dehydrorhamnose reductase
MKTLVFGKTGQVATELARLLPDAHFAGREEADLSDPAACAALIAAQKPDLILNAAAYTAVDKAEEEEPLATVINGDAPTAMAQAAAEVGAAFVHISTDYVFEGGGVAPWTPDAPTGPLGAYGRSKLAGEDGVRNAGGTYAILRTAWVFSAHGNNFVKTMLRLSETRDALNVVNDQIGGPTSAAGIAATVVKIGEQLLEDASKSGTYHYAGVPNASWADFATAIFEEAGRDVTVTGIPASEYPTPAVRPANSRMDCYMLKKTFGITRPDWRADLKVILEELEITS